VAVPSKLTLYVNGDSLLSRRAIVNIRRIIADHLSNGQTLEIVDVVRDPERADMARILATPTLVRHTATSDRRVTGDFSDAQRVASFLEYGSVSSKRTVNE